MKHHLTSISNILTDVVFHAQKHMVTTDGDKTNIEKNSELRNPLL
jgi:hypothetical protein